MSKETSQGLTVRYGMGCFTNVKMQPFAAGGPMWLSPQPVLPTSMLVLRCNLF